MAFLLLFIFGHFLQQKLSDEGQPGGEWTETEAYACIVVNHHIVTGISQKKKYIYINNKNIIKKGPP